MKPLNNYAFRMPRQELIIPVFKKNLFYMSSAVYEVLELKLSVQLFTKAVFKIIAYLPKFTHSTADFNLNIIQNCLLM